MRIDLFSNTSVARDTLRLREQIASRSGSVKNAIAYMEFISSLTEDEKRCRPRIMKEFEFLRDEQFYTTKRYDKEDGVSGDRLLATELLGFFDDDLTPKHTSILDLRGICPTSLSLLTGCDVDSLDFRSEHIKHMNALESFNRDYLKGFRDFPLVGIDPYIDVYVLERYQDLCLDTGTSGEPVMHEAKYKMNCDVIKMMTSIGTYASQALVKNLTGRKAFLRTFNPNIYIIKSEEVLESPVELYYDGRHLFSARLINIDYYIRNRANIGGFKGELSRKGKAS